jgi:peptidoglycan/LPS O-acetylase OafA/YrhL
MARKDVLPCLDCYGRAAWHAMGLIRYFLALVVAADHWRIGAVPPEVARLFDDKVKFGFNAGYAVMLFYVISGFLITFTLTKNYSRDTGGLRDFYRQRFIRIFSLYWPLVLLSFLLVGGIWEQFVTESFWDKFTGLMLLGLDWNLAFGAYPALNWRASIGALNQAWTLGAELTFYLAAPFLLRSWKVGVVVLLMSFALRAVFVSTLGTGLHQVWTYHFVGTTFGFFLLGQLICLASQRWPSLCTPWLGVGLVVCSFAAMTFAGSYVPFDGRRFWLAVVLFTLALPGLFEATKNMRWMNAFGDLSYPIYLVHTLALFLFGRWLLDLLPISTVPEGYVSTVTFLGVTTVCAIIVHRLLERPVAQLMRVGFPRLRLILGVRG